MPGRHLWQAFFPNFFLTLQKLHVVTEAFSSFTQVQINTFNSYITNGKASRLVCSLNIFVIFIFLNQESPTMILGNPSKLYVFSNASQSEKTGHFEGNYSPFFFSFSSCTCASNSSWRTFNLQESSVKDCRTGGTGEPLRLVMLWFSKKFNLVTLILFLMLYDTTYTQYWYTQTFTYTHHTFCQEKKITTEDAELQRRHFHISTKSLHCHLEGSLARSLVL